MTTKLTVTSKNQETLKMNKTNLFTTMRNMAAVVMLSGLSLVGMSFTTDEDTTRTNDTVSKSSTSVKPADSSITVTFMNGTHKIVITNKNAFSATVSVDDMDINAWVNSLMAYSYKKINIKSMTIADKNMDSHFTATEKTNNKMAVEFGKTLCGEMNVADERVTELFSTNVAAPLFSKTVSNEATAADVQMDAKLTEDAELMKQAAMFSKTVNVNQADEEMDLMMNVSVLKNISSKTAVEADTKMDQMLNGSNLKKISPAVAKDADKSMDALLQNNK